MGSDRVAAYVNVLQELLLQDELLRSNKTMSVAFVDHYFRRYVKFFMHEYSGTIDRQAGHGMKFIKFHLTVHRPDDLIKYGSLSNVDTETGEKTHKEISKKPAKATQRHASVLDHQAAQRYTERLLIKRATVEISATNDDCSTDPPNNPSIMATGNSWNVLKSGTRVRSKESKRRNKHPHPWHDADLGEQAQRALKDLFSLIELPDDEQVKVYNQVKVNNVLYRADVPSRSLARNTVTEKGRWLERLGHS